MLAAVVAAYLVVGAAYSVSIPVFEYPDESHHFFVIKYIVDHRALPVQRQELRGPWGQEASQPPLYYLVGVLLVSGIELDGAEDLLWRNPQANTGRPTSLGNKNRYIHPPDQSFPWRGPVLAVHVLRFYSLCLGAVTVGLTWAIASDLFPRQPTLAPIVAATAGFVPQFLFVTSSINNDNAMTCAATLSLYVLLRCVKSATLAPRRAPESGIGQVEKRLLSRQWVVLGVSIGLATLSKLSALALVLVAGLVIAWLGWHLRSWRALGRMALSTLVPIATIAGWWYVRNQLLYGEPSGLTAMWEIVGRRTDFGQNLWGEFRGLRYSFWGLYGWFSILMDPWVYVVLDVLSVLAVGGWVVELLRAARSGRLRLLRNQLLRRQVDSEGYRALALGLLGVWALVLAAALVRWASLTFGSQGRLLYGAMAPFGLLFVLGMRSLLPRWGSVRDLAGAVLAAGLLVLAVCSLLLWIVPQYSVPAVVDTLPSDAVALDLEYGDAVKLHGVRYGQDSVRPGDALTVGLYWEALRSMANEDDLMVWLRMIKERPAPEDTAGGVVALEDSLAGSGTLPTSLWPVGEILEGRQYISIGTETPAPMVARLDLGLYRGPDREPVRTAGAELATIGRVKIVPHQWPEVTRRQRVAQFECGVSLAEYERPLSARPGDTVAIDLVWTVEQAPKRDYVVFVHLEDDQGRIWGYGDSAPRGGNYPTWWWESGEVIQDRHPMTVEQNTPRGRYRVLVGLYDGAGRVAAYSLDGERLVGDAVDLGTVEIR